MMLDFLKRPKPLPQRATEANAQYLASVRPRTAPASTEVARIVATLDEDGIAVIPGFVSRERALDLRQALEPHLRATQAGTCRLENKVERHADYGVYRIHDAPSLVGAADFFDSPSSGTWRARTKARTWSLWRNSPMVCMAPAGTLTLTGTRGIHRATSPTAGECFMLGIYMRVKPSRR